MIGRTIAHYEITEKLGEGAMGEVYQATDTRLKRPVALKMLSHRFASDPDGVARLRREAEVLASLSHAHIGQIYGLEPANDSLVLVLELVEGPTLEDRLKRGPLPLERALRIAHQIAAALELAHERGIIHRDLKPANVKLTRERDVKVLDFGLAKGIRVSPNKTDLTADGAVIGTPAYMSPEQIEGRELDRRTDIWSFGCVLFEMLTGERAFAADSVGSLFARIATETVDLGRLADLPAPVRRLIERCVRKDPRTRLRDIGDARVELEDLLAGRADEPGPAAGERPRRSRAGMFAMLALLIGGLAGGLLAAAFASEPIGDPLRPSRYSISLPPPPRTLLLDTRTGYAPPLAISPDGRKVVFAARDPKGGRRLYLHSADDGRLEPLWETEGAEFPFFSPDGKHVGYVFFGGEDLYRIALSDRSNQQIQDLEIVLGAIEVSCRSRTRAGTRGR
ncbi:MAG: protein kinase domain-containing protein [Planctomycetota bacterium]